MNIPIPGLDSLKDHYLGDPPVLRWLSIHPDGRVVPRESDNQIAYSTRYEMWVQFCLVRDVYRRIDPGARYSEFAATLIPCADRGVVVTARFDEGRPINSVATGMLAAFGVEHEVRGTAAWLATADPKTGLHPDLEVQQLADLLALAEELGAGDA